MEGRTFEVFDKVCSGIISVEEFIAGTQQLLEPTEPKALRLRERLDAGYVNEVDSDFVHVQRVAIIGAGVAGLQTARALTQAGKECVIFEKGDNVGGVWRANYCDFGLQVPSELYEFPEFPYPSDTKFDKFPSGPQVQEYIERYTENFDLKKLVRLNTPVDKIRSKGSKGGRGYTIQCGDANEDFDFVVVSTGMYSTPHIDIPSIRGQEQFKGEILHCLDFQHREAAEGKKVITIGGGKSAIDCAV
jgi:dimethylaniline monooxygenase (N-oxide forming)